MSDFPILNFFISIFFDYDNCCQRYLINKRSWTLNRFFFFFLFYRAGCLCFIAIQVTDFMRRHRHLTWFMWVLFILCLSTLQVHAIKSTTYSRTTIPTKFKIIKLDSYTNKTQYANCMVEGWYNYNNCTIVRPSIDIGYYWNVSAWYRCR